MKNAKIAFLGLDNAGKTSILIALNKKFNFYEEVENLQPTVKIERSSFRFLNSELHQHDFGGQKKYREQYLKFKDRFLSGTDLIFYVIDVQDKERYDESLEYFNAIAEYFKESGIVLPIIVMLHKFDPRLKEDENIIRGVMEIKRKLSEWLPYHNIYYFETTIYDILTVVEAFSFGLAQIFEKREILDSYLAQIGRSFNTLALVLFDGNGIPIGEYYRFHLTQDGRKRIRDLFTSTLRRIADKMKTVYEFSDWISYDMRISGMIQTIEMNDLRFYLLFVIEETSEAEAVKLLDNFAGYREKLEDALRGFIETEITPKI